MTEPGVFLTHVKINKITHAIKGAMNHAATLKFTNSVKYFKECLEDINDAVNIEDLSNETEQSQGGDHAGNNV